MEMYGVRHGADDFGMGVLDSCGSLSRLRFSTAGTVTHCRSGGWRGKNKSYSDNASLIAIASLLFYCRFPDLIKGFLLRGIPFST